MLQTAIANRRHGPAALIGLLLSTASLFACSVPVFRYALEKWPPDSYQATVFHRGPLPAVPQAIADDLGKNGSAGRRHANVSVRLVDLDANPEPAWRDLWQQTGGTSLPWLLVRYPVTTRLTKPVWSGPLTSAAVAEALESPARKKVVEQLVAGESAVWVFLESGDATKDQAAVKLLEERLAYLSTNLKLPKLDPQDIAGGLISVPESALRVGFSLVRVSRADPAEKMFAEMLLGTEEDLAGLREPMAFPIFGRGRALYALVGRGIKHDTIDQAATFLIGKCSCQVKEQNPGTDLLLAANWDELIKAPFNPDRDLPTLAQLAPSAPETVTITAAAPTPGQSPATAMPSATPIFSNLPMTGVVGALLLIATGVLLWRRK